MIRLIALAQQAKPGPPLSPILGQHAIKPAEFITQFNTASRGYTPGTPVGVRITKSGPTKWTLKVCPPTRTVLLRRTTPQVGRTELWAILLYYSTGEVTPQAARTLFGTLQSLTYQVR